jgi:hypothetical protein
MIAGRTNGLASLTHLTKKEIIAVVALDVSIQATGTPIQESQRHFPKTAI